MEEDQVKDSWRARHVSDNPFNGFVVTVPLTISLTVAGSAKTSRMYSGGLRGSIATVLWRAAEQIIGRDHTSAQHLRRSLPDKENSIE